ncbi:MAG: metallophosphatase domain-containing protein [Bernardetiaceae bacterium]|jgi:Icc-related predicted phosphoesterase|nr:metallophosphatase domain-containing protein [Bernardetiaceae bacterium]
MRLVCLSDTHGLHGQIAVPEGDLLLHAGDVSRRGELTEIIEFDRWLGTLPHPHKVIVAGNHDFLFEREPHLAASLISNAIYLNDSGVEIGGVRIWGSPISPSFHNWAFNRERGADIRRHWDLIPAGTDILITHGPPQGVLDLTLDGQAVGCADLREVVQKINPGLHLFGHIHEAWGQQRLGSTLFVNACVLDRYQPAHPVVVLDWPLG